MKFHEEYDEILKTMTRIWGDAVVEGQRNNIVLQILASIPLLCRKQQPDACGNLLYQQLLPLCF